MVVRLSLYVYVLYICIVYMLYVFSFVPCTCIICCNLVHSGMEECLCQMQEFKQINHIKCI